MFSGNGNGSNRHAVSGGLRQQNTPPHNKLELWVERVRGSSSKVFSILSESLWGCWTHWSGKRTYGCLENRSQCYGCQHGWPPRWHGFLHCWDHAAKREVLLELPPLAADGFLLQLTPGESLRGVIIRCARGRGNTSKLEVQVQVSREDPARMPSEKDPAPTLYTLYEVDQLEMGRHLSGDRPWEKPAFSNGRGGV